VSSQTQTPVRADAALPISAVLAAFPVKLTLTELATVQQKASSADIVQISSMELATIEDAPEKELNRILGLFLDQMGKYDNPKMYELMKQLGNKVNEQDLPALATKIMSQEEPKGLAGLTFRFLSATKRKEALHNIWEDTKKILKKKTTTLADFVDGMERELQSAQNELAKEIGNLDQLTAAYANQFRAFAVSVAFLHVFLAQARVAVEARRQAADLSDPTQAAEIRDLEAKLQALESRDLALEGMLTRLPADQMVISQIRQAALATLQETATTAGARFSSIRMTLVTLNITLITAGTQQVVERGNEVDNQLMVIRSASVQSTVAAAANAPGDNRKAQADQIAKIVTDTKELLAIVDKAKVDNAQKFGEARNMFEQARQDMLAIGSGR